jgi:hypothetical protein
MISLPSYVAPHLHRIAAMSDEQCFFGRGDGRQGCAGSLWMTVRKLRIHALFLAFLGLLVEWRVLILGEAIVWLRRRGLDRRVFEGAILGIGDDVNG